jgi:competence protein ComEC
VRWSNADRPVFADDYIKVTGELDPTLGFVNFGIQDLEDHLRRRGVHTGLRAYTPQAVVTVEPGRWWSLPHWATRIRTGQADRVSHAVPTSALPFVLTVWLGDRSRISQEEYQGFIESGTAHILAVSGIHMAILFLTTSALLGFVLKRRTRACVLIIALLLFAMGAGMRVSALRAATMIIIYLLADALDREPDPPTALSLSAILFLFINPDALFDIGFRLSFLSVASILLFLDPIKAALVRVPTLLRESLSTTLAVQIAPLPLAVHTFHVLPLAGPLANLLVIPLLSIALWLCVLTSLAALVSESAALLFGHALLPVVWAIHAIVAFVAAIDLSHVRVTSPTGLAVLLYLVATLVLLIPSGTITRTLRGSAMIALIALTAFCWRPWREEPMVAFLDVGHGDATFIRTPTGATMLVDGGDKSAYRDVGARVVAPFLRTQGVSQLDYVVVTHPDRDHAGGLLHVLEYIDVGQLILSAQPTDRALESDLIALAARKGFPVRRVGRGDEMYLPGMTAQILHPAAEGRPAQEVNDISVVIRLTWEKTTLLLTGDIEQSSERVLAGQNCAATILKVPHHGSNTSSTAPFLDRVNPQWAIVSTGRHRGRAPVARHVAARYKDREIPLWRTDHGGGILLTMDDGKPVLQGAREARDYPALPPQ